MVEACTCSPGRSAMAACGSRPRAAGLRQSPDGEDVADRRERTDMSSFRPASSAWPEQQLHGSDERSAPACLGRPCELAPSPDCAMVIARCACGSPPVPPSLKSDIASAPANSTRLLVPELEGERWPCGWLAQPRILVEVSTPSREAATPAGGRAGRPQLGLLKGVARLDDRLLGVVGDLLFKQARFLDRARRASG